MNERSLWKHNNLESIYPTPQGQLEVDVAVIGGGITGLTAAYLLKMAGRSVALCEKSTIGGGTTGRTTGKVSSQHSLVYADLKQRLGEKAARVYGEANQAAIAQIDTIIKAENIHCDWKRDDSYVYTTHPDTVPQLTHEADVAAQIGLPATFETEIPLPFEVAAAVKFKNQAKLHAVKYLHGLAAAVNGSGSHVFEKSNVLNIKDGKPAVIRTLNARIVARDIIVATNVPTFPLIARGGYCLLEYPTESYIVAGHTEHELKGMYISPDKDNYSILPITIGSERWLLVGGEGHISGMRGNTHMRHKRLSRYAAEKLALNEINYRWSDRDYMAYDGVPLVGKAYPWSKHLYIATAFKKWGLTGGTVAAMILRDHICGNQNAWANVFDTRRSSPMASIPRTIAKYIGLRY